MYEIDLILLRKFKFVYENPNERIDSPPSESVQTCLTVCIDIVYYIVRNAQNFTDADNMDKL